MGHYNSFLVKIWADDKDKLIRGQIQHVGTKDVVYFRTWKKMVGFMAERLGINCALHIEDDQESKTTWITKGE